MRASPRCGVPEARYAPEHDAFPLAQPSAAKPLAGLRVIDAGTMVAAPFATVLLADFGADVIKIEHPTQGDGQRIRNIFHCQSTILA